MMAKESQKPPYEESAVAPNVFPTAISLVIRQAYFAREHCGNKAVDLPHACKQLNQPTVAKRQSNYYVGGAQSSSTHVDQAQDKSCQGESGQAKGCRIGDFPVLDLTVGTWLKLSSKGGQTVFTAASVGVGEGAITEAGSGFGGLMLLVGHLAAHANAIDTRFLIKFVRAGVCVGVICFDGHGEVEKGFDRFDSLEVLIMVGGKCNDLRLWH